MMGGPWRVLACLAALAVAAAAGPGCKKKADADLVLVSPHNKKIEAEFEQAFQAWHQQAFGTAPKLEWRDIGGTTSITHALLELYKHSDASGIDLYFGGGGPDHRLLTARGITVPVELPKEILQALPKAINGIEQYDPDGHWYGATVSAFGIVYNARLLKEKQLPLPQRWEDLAAPAMYRWVAAADATKSGSARAAYEMVIQSEKSWPAGWAKLLRIFANCKRFTGGASDIPRDVADGEVLAGAAIDFYAYDQIAASGESVGFALVPGTTAFTPDPIALLKGAPHPQMARRFIEFVLSPRGQALWCLPAGAPDGPKRYALYRQPIRQDIYQRYQGRLLPELVNPFTHSAGFRPNTETMDIRISRLLGPLMKAAAIDHHAALSRAWKAIIDAGMPQDLLDELAVLPADLAEEAASLETARKLADETAQELTTRAWQQFFLSKYEDIVKRAQQRIP